MRDPRFEREGFFVRARRAAVGKAIIVYLLSGSVVAAIAAYFIFSAMNC